MSQEAFNFGRLWNLDDEYKKVFRAADDAKDQIGLIVAAGASGMKSPDIIKTFEPNSGRHLRMHTVMALGAAAGPDARRAIITPVARLFGFSIEPERTMDPTEENRITREFIAINAPALLPLLDKRLGR